MHRKKWSRLQLYSDFVAYGDIFMEPSDCDEIPLCKLEVRDYWRNKADGVGITDQKMVAVHGSPTPLILILANQLPPPPETKENLSNTDTFSRP
jgi:hypothetical protein